MKVFFPTHIKFFLLDINLTVHRNFTNQYFPNYTLIIGVHMRSRQSNKINAFIRDVLQSLEMKRVI